MEIVRKTARDGRTTITVDLREPASPLDSYRLVVTHGGKELPCFSKRPRPMDEPTGDLTHGLVIGTDSKSVGLTAAEAARIDRAIDAWVAERRGPAPTDAEADAAVAAMHCKACDLPLSILDMEITSLEGYHPDCV